jgi:SAM-dependent methyltransferase
LNLIRLPRRAYDAVVFHESLHHVSSVEKLLDRVRLSLKPGGLLFLDEWTGPSRTEWDERRMSRVRPHFNAIAASWRKWPECLPPISVDDPSEAIRSSAILPTVHRLFSTILERPYGGHIVSLLLPQVARERLPGVELNRMISGWLAVEDDDLARDPRLSVYTAVLARPRTGISVVVGRLINVALRVALAVRYRVLPRVGLNPERSPAP